MARLLYHAASSILFLMKEIQFHFDGVVLEHDEAELILNNKGKLKINVRSLIDNQLDYQKLFELAVAKKNSDLATLAARIGMSQDSPAKATPKRIKKNLKVNDVIDACLSNPSYRTVGVATLLMYATDEKRTMKSVATSLIQDFYENDDLPLTCRVFKGFEVDTYTGVVAPIEKLKNANREGSYYSSPLYVSLCQGMKFMRTNDLVNVEERWSFGGKNASDQAMTTQRKYYVYSLTDKGEEIRDTWGDIGDFVVNYWKPNVEYRQTLREFETKAA